MFLSKKCKNIHRKPISIKKRFIQTEIKEETLTLINEKKEEDSIEETVSKEDLKKKTKKKNNKE